MTEPFPPLHGASHGNGGTDGTVRRRRKSSALGSDVPGDVDVPAFATHRRATPPLNSPMSGDAVCSFSSRDTTTVTHREGEY